MNYSSVTIFMKLFRYSIFMEPLMYLIICEINSDVVILICHNLQNNLDVPIFMELFRYRDVPISCRRNPRVIIYVPIPKTAQSMTRDHVIVES